MLLWIKALHVIAVISWMAGLLYLPRLFVYHCEAREGLQAVRDVQGDGAAPAARHHEPGDDRGVGDGAVLAWAQGMINDRWLWAKFALVVLLTGYHHALGAWRKDFAEDWNVRPPRFYRIMNEVPTLLMIGIVVLVIVKPF